MRPGGIQFGTHGERDKGREAGLTAEADPSVIPAPRPPPAWPQRGVGRHGSTRKPGLLLWGAGKAGRRFLGQVKSPLCPSRSRAR